MTAAQHTVAVENARFAMTMRVLVTVATVAAVTAALGAQPVLPPIRPIGPVVRVSAHGLLRSAATARQFPDGRVIVGDLVDKRVVILDATLQHRTTVGDTTATGSAATFLAGVIPYRGDSTVLVDREAVALVLVDSHGTVARVTAMLRPNDIGQLYGGPYGTPAFDPLSRLIYRASAWLPFDPQRGPSEADSAAIVRLNLQTRAVDTIARYRIVPARLRQTRGPNGEFRVVSLCDPMPTSDDWGVLSDGTVAVVRGRDYHVELHSIDGQVRVGPKVPYAWRRLTEADKIAFRDSVIASMTAKYEALEAQDSLQRRRLGLDVRRGPRFECSPASEMPDYRPPFGDNEIRGSIVRVDREDNLWIRTNTVSNGGPVYDVVNREGRLVDRVRLPFGRSIAGFGDKTVLMAVIDGESVLIEVARMK